MKLRNKLGYWFIGIALLVSIGDTHWNAKSQVVDTEDVSALAWSPDGTKLAFGYFNSRVDIWDMEENKLITSIEGHSGYIVDIAWNSIGTQIVTNDYQNGMYIWDVENGNLLVTLESPPAYLNTLGWSSDDQQILASDGSDPLHVWDVTTGELLNVYAGVGVGASSYAWSPSKESIAYGTPSSVRTMNASNFELERTFHVPENDSPANFNTGYLIGPVSWHPSGEILAGGSFNGLIRLWDVATGEIVKEFNTPSSTPDLFTTSIADLQFSTDGNQLMSISFSGLIQTWDVATGALLEETQLATPFYRPAFSPFGGQVALGGAIETDHPHANAVVTRVIANGAVEMTVPNPSRELLESVRGQCVAAMQRPADLPELPEQANIPAFVRQVRGLQERGAVPSGCAADLIAVAEALQDQ